MNDNRRCPECNEPIAADAPAGLCPKCLYQAALASEPTSGQATSPKAGGPVQPLPIERLAAAFPQLEDLELLGQGGMGVVYKARQPALDRWVAIKILQPELAANVDFSERFMREARTLARLGNHPHIVTIYDVGQADGLLYVSMEYVDGVNLRAAMRKQRLTPAQSLSVVGQICDALQFAHDQGIVHRDIKPENILLDRRGSVKIADFGLAKLLSEDAADESLTRTHQVLGTPRYMAPEQMEGSQQIDHRADIYSLGVVFYEILTGEVPLGNYPPPSKKAPVDARLDDVVLRTLHRAPEDRYQHASEVKSDVENIGATAPPIPNTNVANSHGAVSRFASPALVVAIALLLTCGGGTATLGLLGLAIFGTTTTVERVEQPEESTPSLTTMSSMAKAGDLEGVKRLLQSGEDPNQLDAAGYTPLIMAAIGGHSHVARALLDAGAELEQRSPTGTTALMEAAFSGHLAVARVLIDGNSKIKATDNNGRTALDHAVCTDQLAMTEFLIDRGAQQTGPYRTWQAHRQLTAGETREAYKQFELALSTSKTSPTLWQYQTGEWRYRVNQPEIYLEICALEVAQRLGDEEQVRQHLARLQKLTSQQKDPIYIAHWLSPSAKASKQPDLSNFIETTYWLPASPLTAVAAEWRTPLELRYSEHKVESQGRVTTESTNTGTVKGVLRM